MAENVNIIKILNGYHYVWWSIMFLLAKEYCYIVVNVIFIE